MPDLRAAATALAALFLLAACGPKDHPTTSVDPLTESSADCATVPTPADGKVEVTFAGARYELESDSEGRLIFAVDVENTTSTQALATALALRVIVDGADLTTDLGEDFSGPWGRTVIDMDPHSTRSFGDDVSAPVSWYGRDVELRATADAGGWCAPVG